MEERRKCHSNLGVERRIDVTDVGVGCIPRCVHFQHPTPTSLRGLTDSFFFFFLPSACILGPGDFGIVSFIYDLVRDNGWKLFQSVLVKSVYPKSIDPPHKRIFVHDTLASCGSNRFTSFNYDFTFLV